MIVVAELNLHPSLLSSVSYTFNFMCGQQMNELIRNAQS